MAWWGGCEGRGPFGDALAVSHPQLIPRAWRGRAGLSPSTFPPKKQPPCAHAREQIDLKWWQIGKEPLSYRSPTD